LVEFEATLAARQAKALKRRQQQLKADAERAQQAVEAEKARKAELEAKKREREEAELEKKRRKQFEEAKAVYRHELGMYNLQHELISVHVEAVLAIQKKSKALRKKLRDIDDLKSKVDQLVRDGCSESSALKKLTPEQRDKLRRRQAVLDDIAEQDELEDEEVDETVAKLMALSLSVTPHSRIYVPSAAPVAGVSSTDESVPNTGAYGVSVISMLNTLVARGVSVLLPPTAPEMTTTAPSTGSGSSTSPLPPSLPAATTAVSSAGSKSISANNTDVTSPAASAVPEGAASPGSNDRKAPTVSAATGVWGRAAVLPSTGTSTRSTATTTSASANSGKNPSPGKDLKAGSTGGVAQVDDEWNVVSTTKKGKRKP
jgi:hypothetical protein